jgi:hypothetical protein
VGPRDSLDAVVKRGKSLSLLGFEPQSRKFLCTIKLFSYFKAKSKNISNNYQQQRVTVFSLYYSDAERVLQCMKVCQYRAILTCNVIL